MLKRAAIVALALGASLAAGCSRKPAPTINASMTQVMAPQTQTVWDVTSRAFNAKGDGLDPSKLSDKDWADVGEAGRQLGDRARLLARNGRVTVAAPGETIMGASAAPPGTTKQTWDAASAKQIQALIDANPALFAQRAQVLVDAGDALVKAARAKDVRTLYEVSSGMDEVCDGCHQKFWGTDEPPPYPH